MKTHPMKKPCRLLGLASCLIGIAPLAQDAYEPDDASSMARTIANGQTQIRSIHRLGDADWASFSIAEGGARNLRVTTDGTTGDTELWIYGPNGTSSLVAYRDDTPTSRFARVDLPALNPGTYYVKVTSYAGRTLLSRYTLAVAWDQESALRPDAWEPDEQPETARPVVNGVTQRHSLHLASDIDWVRFTIPSGIASNLVAETSGPIGDTEMFLFGPDDPDLLLDYDDDSGTGTWSRISRARLSPGTYFLAVAGFDRAFAIASYDLRVTWNSGSPGDAYEPDGTPSDAQPLANGQPQDRSLHLRSDVDWARFTVPEGAQNLVIETSGTSGDTELWLVGPNSTTAVAAYDDDSGTGNFSRIALPTPWPGNWLVRVTSYNQLSPITGYQLRASWVEPSPLVAAPVCNPPSGSFTAPFTVVISSPTQGATIHYTTDGSTPSTSSPRYTGPITVDRSLTLRAIAVRSGYRNSAVSNASYQFPLRCDETNDQPSDSVILPATLIAQDSICRPDDVDWFTFTVPAGNPRTVQIQTSGPVGDTVLSLYGPGSSARWITTDDDGGSGFFSRIALGTSRPLLPGTYFIRVEAYDHEETIPFYVLSVSLGDLGTR